MSPVDGDLRWPEVSHEGVTEIVVHGVGGAPPADMLDTLEVRQVTGDRISGMWRPLSGVPGQARHREAYSWGGLTRRPLASALWLLLLPFALANIAGWMATGRRRWAVRYQQSLVRVFSILCTWTYVLFTAQMAMDLGAWQCVRVDTCRIGGWWPDGYTPAQAAAIAALVPGLLIFVLWLATHRSRGRYEDFFPDRSAMPPGDLDAAAVGLEDTRFWAGRASSDHRMWLHLSSSILVIATLLATIADHDLLLLLNGTLLTAAVILAGADRFAGRILKGLKGKLAILGALAIGVWSALAAFEAPPSRSAIMPGMLDAFNGVMVAAYATVLLLVVAVWAGGWSARGARGLLRAVPAQVVVLTLGTWLMFAVLSGTVITVARLLNPAVGPIGDARANVLLYPTPYIPLARISIAGLLIVGLCALAHYLWHAWSPKAKARFQLDRERGAWEAAEVDGLEPEDRGDWERRVRASVRRAEIIAWAETGIAVLTILAVVASVSYSVYFGWQWLGGEDVLRAAGAIVVAGLGFTAAGAVAGNDSRTVWRALLALLAIGAGVAAAAAIAMPALPLPEIKPTPSEVDLSFLPVGLVTLALTFVPTAVMLFLRKALQDRRTLGHIAVAWDILTFWPRSFHPMAPPSYAERAVPELTLRLTHVVRAGQSALLMGHSQGSVVAACAMAQLRGLEDEQRQRISVITYGSPLQSLYARWFPCYINRDVLNRIRDGVYWVNFFRRTDPIGHEPIFGEDYAVAELPEPPGGDVMLPDPASDRHRPGDPDLEVRGHAHGGYIRQSVFRRHLEAEVRRLTAVAYLGAEQGGAEQGAAEQGAAEQGAAEQRAAEQRAA